MAETFARTFDLDTIEIQRGGDGRTVTAYAAVFGQDAEIRDVHGHYIERIDPRAFAKTLQEQRPERIGVLYNHGYDTSGRPNMVGSVPIGTPLEITADGRGLLTVTRYNRSQMADAVLEAIRDGQIRGQSFRGRIINSRTEVARARGGVKTIIRTELGLREYGPTHSPAYEGAGILAVRSQDPDFLELLRGMIRTEINGTSSTPEREPDSAGPSGAHPGRTQVQRARLALRARTMGVERAETPAE